MRKEDVRHVGKTWGMEHWLVNNDLYCGKILMINRGKQCSYHCHKNKQETFCCLDGGAVLTVEGEEYGLTPEARPKTIYPGEYHRFKALKNTVLLEVSTHHEDDDTYRRED